LGDKFLRISFQPFNLLVLAFLMVEVFPSTCCWVQGEDAKRPTRLRAATPAKNLGDFCVWGKTSWEAEEDAVKSDCLMMLLLGYPVIPLPGMPVTTSIHV